MKNLKVLSYFQLCRVYIFTCSSLWENYNKIIKSEEIKKKLKLIPHER